MKTVNTKNYTDIKRLVWIERLLPASWRPYAYLLRLDRPIGVWLLLLPSLWSIILVSGGAMALDLRGAVVILLFCIGAVVMRGAGCVVNDLWDRDLDKAVERTKDRPIASGVVSPKRALVFLATLLLFGLGILLQFNVTTIFLGFLSLPLVVLYPLMKRITWWPQAFLGITFNFGTLMGWSAITGELGLPAILLYLGGLFWTIGYDTIYAHQDKEDDVLIGIKSTALKFGDRSKIWVSVFFALAITLFTTALYAAGTQDHMLALMLIPAAHMIWQIKTWDMHSQERSLHIFKSNMIFGLLILLAFAL